MSLTLGRGDVTGIDAVAPLTTVGVELLVTVVAVEEDAADVDAEGAAVVVVVVAVVVAAAVVPLDDCLRNILDNI